MDTLLKDIAALHRLELKIASHVSVDQHLHKETWATWKHGNKFHVDENKRHQQRMKKTDILVRTIGHNEFGDEVDIPVSLSTKGGRGRVLATVVLIHLEEDTRERN